MPEAAKSGVSIKPIVGSALRVERDDRRLLDVAKIELPITGLTVILGPNGAGKSLLLRILAGLLKPDSGQITWNGKSPSRRHATRLGFVFQSPVFLRRSVRANVEYALRAAGFARSDIRQRALSALMAARLSHVATQSARSLSGGEKQRLALARALALQPEVLFLDEPAASLDPASVLAVEEMVRSAVEQGIPTVLVTHDVAQGRRLADTVVFMHHGRIVEHRPAELFFNNPSSDQARAFVAGEIVL